MEHWYHGNLLYNAMLKEGIINVVIRSLTLASKFVLIFFIAKYLSPEEMGEYGLFTITIGIAIYFLGMDFYIFNTREILSSEKSEQVYLIRDQIIFHILVYLFVLPMLIFVFFSGTLSWKYAPWFYILLILEHLSQESSRLLITISRPLISNIVQFVRSGLWVYFAVAVAAMWSEMRNLTTLWFLWCIGGISSLWISCWILKKSGIYIDFNRSINWQWIRKGLKQSSLFFLSTLALMITQYIDRYLLKYYYGESLVGVYTFYCNIANVIQVFIYTGIIVIIHPKIIQAYQKNKVDEYRALMKKLSTAVIVGTIPLSLLAAVAIKPILMLVNKSAYQDHLTAYWILLIAVVINVLGQIPHYALYAKKKDKAIFISTICAMSVSILMNILLIPIYGLIGAAMSSVLSMITLASIKFIKNSNIK